MSKKTESKRSRHLHHPTLKANAEKPWRDVLVSMSHEELVEAALSAAWEIKSLEEDIDRLWAKVQSAEEARRKAPAARLANDKKAAAKVRIHEIWKTRRKDADPSTWNQNEFAKEMWELFREIEDFRTLQRWVREWKREAETSQTASEPSSAWRELEARWHARPEVHKLLHYLPDGFFKDFPA